MKQEKNKLIVKDKIIREGQFANNQTIEEVDVFDACAVCVAAFKDCVNLKDVYFGPNIKIIDYGAFDCCTSLTDVWFAILEENQEIIISDNAFRNCDTSKITFHIFASALKNKSLNEYAEKHGIRVTGMI